MDVNSFFPVMGDPVGAGLPALIALALVCARRARCGLRCCDRIWLVVLSLALTVVLARMNVSDEHVVLHLVPGATVLVCYLVWAGHAISPGFAFVLTYATSLPVDVVLARLLLGADFDPAAIGGGGWRDGLLVLPTLTALAVMYANWRMRGVRRSRVLGFGAAPCRQARIAETSR
jgi:hypothetical protein